MSGYIDPVSGEPFEPTEPPPATEPTPAQRQAIRSYVASFAEEELLRRDPFDLGRSVVRAAIRAGSGYGS